ncbi:M48 family metalloprotease [Pelagibius sp.]|uniref:M48 family metalloprotease n=1 Tax=Pelagibius sp. TaxID=1931238 RepID=UPI0026278697|nr:M48 family metalloprotease [Pelagibius sp.]
MRKPPVPLLFVVILLLGALLPQRADADRLRLIRDAEIESIIRTYATPLFQAAGLSPQGIRLYLVQDRSLNAFVAGGLNMFINTGLLMQAEHPGQVIGVIAHETGHISGGHLATRGTALEQTRGALIATYLLGIGAALATGEGGVGAAVISGGQDVALRGLLQYTRTQESSADQAAVTLLQATGQSPRGLLEFMEKLKGQEVLLTNNQDPYLRTHPLTQERITFLENALRQSPYADTPPSAELVVMHDRMRAKLIGFLQALGQVLRVYPEEDTSLPARYARAIAYYRVPDIEQALGEIDGLLAEAPGDPYFRELKGQMLLEHGRVAEALPEYQAAANALPDAPQIRQALAKAQIQLDDREMDRAALSNLAETLRQEPNNPSAWRLAAVAHGRLGDQGMTALALAESALARGRFAEARDRANHAIGLLEENSASWLRAQDLKNEAERRLDK